VRTHTKIWEIVPGVPSTYAKRVFYQHNADFWPLILYRFRAFAKQRRESVCACVNR